MKMINGITLKYQIKNLSINDWYKADLWLMENYKEVWENTNIRYLIPTGAFEAAVLSVELYDFNIDFNQVDRAIKQAINIIEN